MNVVRDRRCALSGACLVSGRRPGVRPGGRGTFLCLAKEKYPKERRPDVHALLRRVRCAAQLGRGLAKLANAQTDASPFSAQVCAARRARREGGSGNRWLLRRSGAAFFNRRVRLLRSAVGRDCSAQPIQQIRTSAAGCIASTDFVCAFASSPAPDFPVGQGRAAECQVDKGSRLSERSEFSGAPPGASSAGNHEVALTSGRLFFGYFLLAKQKKVARPPGRTPGLRPQTESRSHKAKRRHHTVEAGTRHTPHWQPYPQPTPERLKK